ncbi:MAG: hypothetical protein ACR2JY_15180 [Chloroflexota bacterium]
MSDDHDAPSIIDREITDFRGGVTLRYSNLTACEKRDYLFEAGIRATAYANDQRSSLLDIHYGLLQFAESDGYSLALFFQHSDVFLRQDVESSGRE